MTKLLWAMAMRTTVTWVVVALIGGCAGNPQPAFEPQRVIPHTWQGQFLTEPSPATRLVAEYSDPVSSGGWWLAFDSPELNLLMEQAMAGSFTLRASQERVEQARARLTASRSVLFPQLDASYSVSRSDQWQGGNRSGDDSDRFHVGASYEVDLWGRVRTGVRSSLAALEASEFAHLAARLSVEAELAGAYLQWLAAQDRLRFAQDSFVAVEEVLRLVELQYREGSLSQLEWVQQQATVATQRARINDLENARLQIEYALAVLVGLPPGSLELTGRSLAEITIPAIEPEQPAELLRRRPDLLQAERQLQAASANTELTRLALLPGLRLSASANTAAVLTGGISATAATLGASLAQPLFQGGSLRADIAAAEAGQREVLASFYHTALEAILEVENALADLATQDTNRELESRSLELAERAYELADLRYRSGAVDYLTLLDAQRNLIDRQDSYVQFELSRYQGALNLYRALGGSWASGGDA